MKIYQISGMGANEKVFKNLRINEDFETVNIPWLQPENDETLEHYSERMAENIDLNDDFILMGVSFGGIVIKEMNRFLTPKFNFLISTIKNREEMPWYMKFDSHIPLHKIVPTSFLTSDNLLSYAVFRKMYSAKLPDLKEIFEFRNHYYLKWSMGVIVNWNNNSELKNFVHYHGNKDIIFPSSKIKNATIIEGGTHVMVMNKPRQLNRLINKKLEEF